MMLGLARSERLYGGDVEDYIKALESFVKGNINSNGQIKRNGDARPTENARVALAASALGYDARSFAGYDLLAALKIPRGSRNRAITRPRLRFWR